MWHNQIKLSAEVQIDKAKYCLWEAVKILAKTTCKLADEHTVITDCAAKMIPGESVSLWHIYNL